MPHTNPIESVRGMWACKQGLQAPEMRPNRISDCLCYAHRISHLRQNIRDIANAAFANASKPNDEVISRAACVATSGNNIEIAVMREPSDFVVRHSMCGDIELRVKRNARGCCAACSIDREADDSVAHLRNVNHRANGININVARIEVATLNACFGVDIAKRIAQAQAVVARVKVGNAIKRASVGDNVCRSARAAEVCSAKLDIAVGMLPASIAALNNRCAAHAVGVGCERAGAGYGVARRIADAACACANDCELAALNAPAHIVVDLCVVEIRHNHSAIERIARIVCERVGNVFAAKVLGRDDSLAIERIALPSDKPIAKINDNASKVLPARAANLIFLHIFCAILAEGNAKILGISWVEPARVDVNLVRAVAESVSSKAA